MHQSSHHSPTPPPLPSAGHQLPTLAELGHWCLAGPSLGWLEGWQADMEKTGVSCRQCRWWGLPYLTQASFLDDAGSDTKEPQQGHVQGSASPYVQLDCQQA